MPPPTDNAARPSAPARPTNAGASTDALRERFDRLLNGRAESPRSERAKSAAGKSDSAAEAEQGAEEGERGTELLASGDIGRPLRDAASGTGQDEGAFTLVGLAGPGVQAIGAMAEMTGAGVRGGDPAMLHLAERIANLNLPPAGTWQVELPGADRIAARVERAAQGGGYAIALHLPTRTAEHRRRLAAELAMHLDARGVPRCIVGLADDPPAG